MLFGWRHVGTTHETRMRFGFYIESFSSGMWANIYWGRRWWAFTRYTRNRHTGPRENRAVLKHFFGDPDKRVKGSSFSHGFATAAKKPAVKLPWLRRSRMLRWPAPASR